MPPYFFNKENYNMRLLITIAVVCLFPSIVNAQKTYGYAEYEIQLGEDNFPFKGKLYFDDKSSTFISKQSTKDEWVIKKQGPNQEYLTDEVYSDTIGHTVLKVLDKQKLTVRDFCEPGKPVIYEDSVFISWRIKKETKKVQGLQCQKATANFRGRKYEAWFAIDVPVPFGPWKFHGLPGLIIELSDVKKEVVINLTKMILNEVNEKIYYLNGNEDRVKATEFYSCLDRRWKKALEVEKAMFARLQAEHPNLEIELEIPKNRPATELEFE